MQLPLYWRSTDQTYGLVGLGCDFCRPIIFSCCCRRRRACLKQTVSAVFIGVVSPHCTTMNPVLAAMLSAPRQVTV